VTQATDLVARHQGTLRANVTRVLRAAPRRFEVEDVTQQTWIRLLERFGPDLDGLAELDEASASAYVAAAARNTACDCLRRARRVRNGRNWLRDDAGAESVADPTPHADHRLIAEQLRTQFRAELLSIATPRTAAIVVHAVVDGYGSRRIAEDLGVTTSTVDSAVSRARRALAQRGLTIPRRAGHDLPCSERSDMTHDEEILEQRATERFDAALRNGDARRAARIHALFRPRPPDVGDESMDADVAGCFDAVELTVQEIA